MTYTVFDKYLLNVQLCFTWEKAFYFTITREHNSFLYDLEAAMT